MKTMKMRWIQLIFVTLGMFYTHYLFAFDGVCKLIFTKAPSQESLFAKIENLESKYQDLLILATISYGQLKDQSLVKSLDQVVEQIQLHQSFLDKTTSSALENQIDSSVRSLFMSESNFKSLRDRLDKMLHPEVINKQNYRWNDIVENPYLLKAYKLYETEGQSQAPIKVKFSPKILDELFHSNQPLDQIAAKKALRAMTRFVGNSDSRSSGLVELKAAKGVYEVRIVGHTVGAIRVAGIKENGVIHIVHVDRHSNHNATHGKHLVKNAISKFEHEFK